MQGMLPGPHDAAHVAGSGTGTQTSVWRSITVLMAMKAERCPAVMRAVAGAAAAKMHARVDGCMVMVSLNVLLQRDSSKSTSKLGLAAVRYLLPFYILRVLDCA
jgi:hypothetical protein